MIHTALQTILRCAGLDPDNSARVRFIGIDPVFPIHYRIGTAGAATLGALELAIADLRERQTGRRTDVEIEVRTAAASLRSSKYIRVDGRLGAQPLDTITGF